MDGGQTLETLIKDLRVLVKQNTKNKSKRQSRLQNLEAQNADTIIEIITSAEASVDVVGWLIKLYTQHKHLLPLDASQLEHLIEWLRKQLRPCVKDEAACRALVAIAAVIKAHPTQTAVHWEGIFHPLNSTFLRCLGADCCAHNDEFTIAALQCCDTMLGCLETTTSTEQQLSARQSEVCAALADLLLRMHYAERGPPCSDAPGVLSTFLLTSLTLLNKVATLCSAYAQAHISELLGLARAYMTSGADGVEASFPLPQRVAAAQQSLYDSAEELEASEAVNARRSNGGKVSKTRKPRAVVKGQKKVEQPESPQRFEFEAIALIKTSDSDASDTEIVAGNRITHERHRRAKLRLAAITLVGVVTRAQQKRMLFGYWHALFASVPVGGDDGAGHRVDLLHCAQHDPNVRCRSAALQVAAQLLLGSKCFLSQAEWVAERPSAFLPFAQSLAQMVVAMYETLTAILAAESSLPVLTQALKCLAVLVQATPFLRLQSALPMRRFVQQVRRLVHHRDCTIQVSALMVMEFLVAAPELTPEIAEAVGLPRLNAKANLNDSRLIDKAVAELMPAAGEEEEYIESDEEESSEREANDESTATSLEPSSKTSLSASWLLLRVLHNLDGGRDLPQQQRPPTSVRIESLQVLAAMSAHFTLLSAHLARISFALQLALQDPLPDVRLYAARTLNSCAYQIGRHQLETTTAADDLAACDDFWTAMLPGVMTLLVGDCDGASDELRALKICLCDALSNVGVVQFERLTHATRLGLLNVISSISSDDREEMSVRAAAVRALAVFVLFPSLFGNLGFVENVAEISLRLASDSNISVRIKAIWSMANVSDALISNYFGEAANASNRFERISDDLVRRLIASAMDACSDHDKVRSNAVRSLGNLLRLLSALQFADAACRGLFQRAVGKLIHCVRTAGNAKVKWNSCYAIGQLLRSTALFEATALYPADMAEWQAALYPALCHVIVAHANFKVRANATVAISHIAEREHFGVHFEAFFAALLAAMEQSNQLDNFYEYNHRDNLQEQLCLTVSHVVACADCEDFPVLRKHLAERLEVVRRTWARVLSRMVPERAAPLLSCSVLLQSRLCVDNSTPLSADQRSAIAFVAQSLAID